MVRTISQRHNQHPKSEKGSLYFLHFPAGKRTNQMMRLRKQLNICTAPDNGSKMSIKAIAGNGSLMKSSATGGKWLQYRGEVPCVVLSTVCWKVGVVQKGERAMTSK